MTILLFFNFLNFPYILTLEEGGGEIFLAGAKSGAKEKIFFFLKTNVNYYYSFDLLNDHLNTSNIYLIFIL